MIFLLKYPTSIAITAANIFGLFSKSKEPAILDMWTRLWKEAEMSIETAEWLTQQIKVNVEIENTDLIQKHFLENIF